MSPSSFCAGMGCWLDWSCIGVESHSFSEFKGMLIVSCPDDTALTLSFLTYSSYNLSFFSVPRTLEEACVIWMCHLWLSIPKAEIYMIIFFCLTQYLGWSCCAILFLFCSAEDQTHGFIVVHSTCSHLLNYMLPILFLPTAAILSLHLYHILFSVHSVVYIWVDSIFVCYE